MANQKKFDYDFIIVGSGFGGSVSALRLSEKGYKVLIIEKGKWLREKDFPKTNWNLKKWFWSPLFRFFGFLKISFFRHITVLSGVGVGGGSLVYANTLPVPKPDFFQSKSWAHLAHWERELKKYYTISQKMLGVSLNPQLEAGDIALGKLSQEMGLEKEFEKTSVGVFFGEPEKEAADPYFKGKGPSRTGCNFCGSCMIGCKIGAKNSLDKNYLFLAQKKGAKILAESEVIDVIPVNNKKGLHGYTIKWRSSTSFFKKKGEFLSKGVIFSGGVLGTVRLFLKLKKTSLPDLSDKVGENIRTNSESLIGVTTFDKKKDFSKGIAIGSILHTDKHTHLEPVRYPSGSGFWRILMSPMVHGENIALRAIKVILNLMIHPIQNGKIYFVWDWAKRTQILLIMQTLDATLEFKRGFFAMKSRTGKGKNPTAFIPQARELANRYAKIVNGKPMVLLTETLLGKPTTAHILGGAVMGKDRDQGVIDKNNRVFGYNNMYICDGSMISANPGVNPSLTITAISERAMSKIPLKK